MAVVTLLSLSLFVEYGIMRCMDGMAAGAGHISVLMFTATPGDTIIFLVAFKITLFRGFSERIKVNN